MDVPLNVDVYCTDGKAGRSVAIIGERATRQVTDFVVKTEADEYIVPLSAITQSTPLRIDLSWSREQLSQAKPFVVEVPATPEEIELMSATMMQSGVLGPYTAPDAGYMASYMANASVPEEQVQAGFVAIHVDDRVEATDGDVGRVDELRVDPETGAITHLVLRTGHLWGKKDVTIPLDLADRVADGTVYLKIDKHAIGALPSIPAPKK